MTDFRFQYQSLRLRWGVYRCENGCTLPVLQKSFPFFDKVSALQYLLQLVESGGPEPWIQRVKEEFEIDEDMSIDAIQDIIERGFNLNA